MKPRIKRPRAQFKPATGPTWPDGSTRSQNNAFDWWGRPPRLNWRAGALAAKVRIQEAKELVESQAHELPAIPLQKGDLTRGFVLLGTRRGDVGRKRMKESAA